jgi:hypothetical protein
MAEERIKQIREQPGKPAGQDSVHHQAPPELTADQLEAVVGGAANEEQAAKKFRIT